MKVSRKVARRSHRSRYSSVSRRRLRNKKSRSGYKKKHAKTQRGGARGYSSVSRRRLRKSKSGSKKRYTQRGRYGGSPEDMIEIRYDFDKEPLNVEVSKMLSVANGIADMGGVNPRLKTESLPYLTHFLNHKKLYPQAAHSFINLFLPAYLRSKQLVVSAETKSEALQELFTPSDQSKLLSQQPTIDPLLSTTYAAPGSGSETNEADDEDPISGNGSKDIKDIKDIKNVTFVVKKNVRFSMQQPQTFGVRLSFSISVRGPHTAMIELTRVDKIGIQFRIEGTYDNIISLLSDPIKIRNMYDFQDSPFIDLQKLKPTKYSVSSDTYDFYSNGRNYNSFGIIKNNLESLKKLEIAQFKKDQPNYHYD